MKQPAAPKAPPRTACRRGVWHWEPSQRLRAEGGFSGERLGEEIRAAFVRARALNRLADQWLKSNPLVKAGNKARPAPAAAPAERALTFSLLANAYRQSTDFLGLRASTQKLYLACLRILEAEFGDERASAITRARVLDWADRLRRTAPQGLKHYAAMAATLYRWGADRELISIEANPFTRMKITANRRAVFITEEDLAALVSCADRHGMAWLGTVMTIGFYCVQREYDVLALTTANLRRHGNHPAELHLVQSKTGKQIEMPLPRPVADRLALAPAPAETRAPLYGWVIDGRPGRADAETPRRIDVHGGYAQKSFNRLRRLISAEQPALGKRLASLQLRDMRRSGFVWYATGKLAADGVTMLRPPVPVPHICSISGHTIEEGMQIVEVYCPRTIDQARMAVRMAFG